MKPPKRIWPGLSVVIFAAGCATERPGISRPEPVDRVEHMQMTVGAAARNLDDLPGPDGVEAALYFYVLNAGKTETRPVKGRVEFLLFAHDGAVNRDNLTELLERERPFATRTFEASRLRRYLDVTHGLWGYRLLITWLGEEPPATKRVVVVGRYISPSGQTLYASPAPVALVAQ